MKHFYKYREIIQAPFFVLLVCILIWQQFAIFHKYENAFIHPQTFVYENLEKDYITLNQLRYKEVLNYLSKPTHITYYSEKNENWSTFAYNYVLTQYYLSPHLIYKDSINRDTILFNLYYSKKINPSLNYHLNNGWKIDKDFNNGLIILTKQ